MNLKQLFISLKQGKEIIFPYRDTYTVRLKYSDKLFSAHSSSTFGHAGESGEAIEMHEPVLEKLDFNEFMAVIMKRYPGILEPQE